MTYDPKSAELAEHFLQDFPHLNSPENLHQLAQTIQHAIESWIFSQENKDLAR